MKRIGNLYNKIYTMDNLQLADAIARKGKLKQPGVIEHDKNRDSNLLRLQEMLINKTYETGPYKTFIVREPKERIISSLDYFPHRIVHHAIMNVVEPILNPMFTADTYANIKGKGITDACDKVKITLKDIANTTYCLKLDVQKFYPSVDPAILKTQLRRKFKDDDLLELFDGIIDSAVGLPIGNYLSQYFANLYLTGFDHWIKEKMCVKYYFRYADDIVILSGSKEYLHKILAAIRLYFDQKLNLIIKHNYQVFPVAARGIDFLGYVFYHTHTRLRKSIKQNYAREVAGSNRPQVIAGFKGWISHCNGRHLAKKFTQCSTLKISTSQQLKERDTKGIR